MSSMRRGLKPNGLEDFWENLSGGIGLEGGRQVGVSVASLRKIRFQIETQVLQYQQ